MKQDLYWPLGISITLVIFVGFLIGFVLYSRTVPVNLVSDNYYENSLNYQKRIDMSQRASAMHAKLNWQYNPQSQLLTLHLPAAGGPATGEVHLFRPADAAKDRHIKLATDAEGKQVLHLAGMDNGLWRVQVYWRQNETDFFAEEVLVIR